MAHPDLASLIEELASIVERGDDGDFDSPSWEAERRLVGLRALVAEMALRHGAYGLLGPSSTEPSTARTPDPVGEDPPFEPN